MCFFVVQESMNYLQHNKVNYLDNHQDNVVYKNDSTIFSYNGEFMVHCVGVVQDLSHIVFGIPTPADTITNEQYTVLTLVVNADCNNCMYVFSLPYTCSNFINIPDNTTVTFTITLDDISVNHTFPVKQQFINTFNLFNIVPIILKHVDKITITAATNNSTVLSFYNVNNLNSRWTMIKFLGFI